METLKIAVFDKLAGELKNYVDEFSMAKEAGRDISIKIDDTIMNEINNDSKWYLQIVRSDDLSTLPQYLQRLIKQFLPEFKKLNPEFKNAECLKEIS